MCAGCLVRTLTFIGTSRVTRLSGEVRHEAYKFSLLYRLCVFVFEKFQAVFMRVSTLTEKRLYHQLPHGRECVGHLCPAVWERRGCWREIGVTDSPGLRSGKLRTAVFLSIDDTNLGNSKGVSKTLEKQTLVT